MRVGQCWELDSKVLEITGFTSSGAEYLEWTPTQNTIAAESILYVDTSDNYAKYPTGLGTSLSISLAALSNSKKLIERAPDKIELRSLIIPGPDHDDIVTRDTLTAKISQIRNRNPIPPKGNQKRDPRPTTLTALEDIYFHTAYTDGSWARTDTIASLLLGNGEIKTAGAIILHTLQGMINIKITMDIDVSSAYEAEVVSLLIAHELAKRRKVTIWTDCEAAMKRLSGRRLGALAQVLNGWEKNDKVAFRKVKAHPERRLPASEWSTEERGNFMADQVAGSILTPAYTIKASEWLKKIGATHSKLTIERTDGTPLIMDVSKTKSKCDVIKYLDERDDFREEEGKTRVWKGANIALHHKLLGRSNKIGDRVITQRIGLNKRWQWHSSRSDNLCQGCMEPILDITHPLRTCRVEEMTQARKSSWEQADHVISRAPKYFHNTLHSISRHMREDAGGEIACCGTFRCDLVSRIPYADQSISDIEAKWILKLLKTIAAGTRRLLRLAAEIQLGPLGINYRQTALTEFFKIKPGLPTKILKKLKETDLVNPTPTTTPEETSQHTIRNKLTKNNKRNKTTHTRITIDDIFAPTSICGNIYWEVKAG